MPEPSAKTIRRAIRLCRTLVHGLLALALLLLLCPGLALATTPPKPEPSLKPVRLMLMWQPQAQFAGYYMAREKGIYARHGLEVTISECAPGHSPLEALLGGEADFAVFWLATALKQQDSGPRLVHLAQIVQRSSLMLVARKASGINRIEDLQNRKVGIWARAPALPILALLDQRRVRPRRVPQGHTVNLFLRGGVDAASATWYNEYHTILSAGLAPDELQVFFLRDHGIKVPEDGLYTLESLYEQDPSLARIFARASLEGWEYAFAHPGETVEVVLRIMREFGVPASRAHQWWMLDRLRELALPEDPAAPMGSLRAESFQAAGQILLDHGLIRAIPSYSTFIQEE